MRGSDATSGSLFSYVELEDRVPAKHPLRTIRAIVNDVLVALDAEFERLYEGTGRQSVAPERLLRASLLQAFYSVRSERQLMEQIDYNLLFRWFVGLGIDDAVWDHSTFSKNRDRLLDADVAAKFLEAVLRHRQVKRFLSDDHFSVDGTLVEAWASLKSFRAKDGSDEPPAPGRNGERDFHGEKRTNATHESKTDPDAKLFRKGNSQPAKLYFMGHALIENRHGLVVQADATQATGEMVSPRRRSLASILETQLGTLVEIPAALLVVAEIVTLFAGVVSRYVLQRPLIWSDELASILFLWLAMLGSVVAFRRSEHMRMTAVVANAKPAMHWRADDPPSKAD